MLLLFPAAVLIVLVLAALAVDVAIVFLGERELANATAAAANDAAAEGVAERPFYEEDRIELDAGTVERLAVERVRAILDPQRFGDLRVDVEVSPPVTTGCPWRVRVAASARVAHLFARAVPGGPHDAAVDAASSAGPVEGAVDGCE